MSKSPVSRGIAAILLASAVAWTVVSCASAPPKAAEPAPAPATTVPVEAPPVEPTAAPPVVKPTVQESAYVPVQQALDEAIAAGAEAFASDLLNQARQSLAQARGMDQTDVAGVESLLKDATAQAHAARDAALARFAADAQKALDEAVAAGAEQFAADLLAQARQAQSQAAAGKDSAGAAATRGLYQSAIDKAHAARDAAVVGAQLAQLDQAVQKAIDEAVAAGAEKYAADLLSQARQAQTQAKGKAVSNPSEAGPLYQTALDRAHEARDAALRAQTKGLLDQLDLEATQAIAQAQAVEAYKWAPAPMQRAWSGFVLARDYASSSPDRAEAVYRFVIDQAHAAKDEAQLARTAALFDKLDAAEGAWKALAPDKWTPEEAAALAAQTEAARSAVGADYAAGFPLATDALNALAQATQKWKTKLAAVQDLRVQAQKALAAAEAADAFVWVPDLVQTANDAFFQGTGAWRKFRLDAAEEAWTTALYQAQSAQAKAQGALDRKRTEQLMLETMKKLEDASGKTVVDPNDNIIPPQAWDGKKELEKLKAKPVSVLIPTDGSVAVMGEKQRVTYLDEAKDQWAQGVKALDAGDLTLANEAFFQAQRLIDTYLSLAVDKLYTVKLNPDKRDSLWRIAGHGDIYDTPWEWPKIWKRNQKLIQNPDLIYPGWQLIIPPQ